MHQSQYSVPLPGSVDRWSSGDTLQAPFPEHVELKLLISEISDYGVELQQNIGAILEHFNQASDAGVSLGTRLGDFKRMHCVPPLIARAQTRLLSTAEPLVPYRNRLLHDRWTSLLPRGTIAAGSVQGFGEAHLISTSIEALTSLRDVFGATAYQANRLYNFLLYEARNLKMNRPFTDADFEEALDEVDLVLNSDVKPKWHQTKALTKKQLAELEPEGPEDLDQTA